jgi:hypothetical protein
MPQIITSGRSEIRGHTADAARGIYRASGTSATPHRSTEATAAASLTGLMSQPAPA